MRQQPEQQLRQRSRLAFFKTFTDNKQRKCRYCSTIALQEFADALRVILNERLRKKCDFLEELVNGTFGDLLDQVFRFAVFASFFNRNAAFCLIRF